MRSDGSTGWEVQHFDTVVSLLMIHCRFVCVILYMVYEFKAHYITFELPFTTQKRKKNLLFTGIFRQFAFCLIHINSSLMQYICKWKFTLFCEALLFGNTIIVRTRLLAAKLRKCVCRVQHAFP